MLETKRELERFSAHDFSGFETIIVIYEELGQITARTIQGEVCERVDNYTFRFIDTRQPQPITRVLCRSN